MSRQFHQPKVINRSLESDRQYTADQTCYFVANPTTEGVFPGDRNKPAIAYSKAGDLPALTWDTTTQAWL